MDPLAKLRDDLEHAFNSEPERNSPEEERLRYIFALTKISQFLKKVLSSKISSKRIYELAVALEDLDHGRVDPLLNPSSPSTSASPTRIWCERARVAVALHAYINAGLNRQQAAKKLASKFPELGKLAAFERGYHVSSTTTKILGWYDEFRKPIDKSRIKNETARYTFEQGQQLIPAQVEPAQVEPAQVNPDDFAKKYLSRLRGMKKS